MGRLPDRHHGGAGPVSPLDARRGDARQPEIETATVGRREFAAGLALASVAFLGGVRASSADGGEDDAVKQLLMDIKDLVCQVSEYFETNGLDGPLESQEDIDYVVNRIYRAGWKAQKVMNRRWSALFSPPDYWLYWMPPDATGLSLQQATSQACHDACEALERYCEEMESGGSEYEPAAHSLWLAQAMLCHVMDLAGIVP